MGMHPDDAASLAGTTDTAGALAIQSMSFFATVAARTARLPRRDNACASRQCEVRRGRGLALAYAIRRVNAPTVDRLVELHSDAGRPGDAQGCGADWRAGDTLHLAGTGTLRVIATRLEEGSKADPVSVLVVEPA